ncbi:MAG: glycosyltransferase family 4 protein [Bacteroidia bacterium]|nr:glycosyltransferase family 4 protein [Bacteroidia bacterium]
MNERTIAVNVRHLIPNKMEGIGWFSYQIMKRITQKNPDIHFYFLFDRNFDTQFIFSDNITPIILSPPARHPVLIYYWNEWEVPNFLNKIQPNVYLSLDGFISKRAKYKQYAVVHDLNFLVYPQYLTWSVRKLYHYFFTQHIHHANRIGTVSEFSKSEIMKYFHIPESKIDVVFSASNLKLRTITSEEQNTIKTKYAQSCNYFLYVSSIHPRKNVTGIIKAFDKYKSLVNTNDKLLIVGRFFWGKEEIMNVVQSSKHKDDIIFTGRLDDNESMLLMKFAKALLLVSFYEGFGVPVIESMQLGTPVITSNTTALNEISGDAAIKVNPENTDEIANAMKIIHEHPELVKQLINKGLQQAEKFSWDISANLLWNGVQKLLSANN